MSSSSSSCSTRCVWPDYGWQGSTDDQLTHIVHGPHDTSFYKLLAELEEEYYDLKRKGYTGEGFHSDGNRLQGTRLNEYEGRRRGLAAAEKRMKQQLIMGRGGVLGGSKVTDKSMREIVAEVSGPT